MLPGAVRTIQTNKRVPLVSSGNQPASTHMVFSHLCRGKVQSTLLCRACLRLAREWEFWRSLEHCSLLLNAHCPGLGGRLPSRRASVVHPYFVSCHTVPPVSFFLQCSRHLTFPQSPTNTPRFTQGCTAFLTLLCAWLTSSISCQRPAERKQGYDENGTWQTFK